MRAAAAITTLAMASVLAAPAAAQPMDTYGMSSRSVALAGAVSADVEDGSANYYNPAGIVRDGRLHIGLGWFGAIHDLYLNEHSSDVDPVHGVILGLNVPGKVGDFRFGFGLGVHLNDQRVSRTRTLPRAWPRWELYDNRPHRTYLSTHVAIQPVEWLRIGGGMAFLSYSSNQLRLRGEPNDATHLSRIEHELVGELTTIRYPQVGIQLGPWENFNFGITYRGEYALDNKLVAEVGNPDGSPVNGAVVIVGPYAVNGYFFLLTQSVNAYVPHQISFGASWQPVPELRVGMELTWLMWSLYVSPIGRSRVILDIDTSDLPPDIAGMIRIPENIPEQMPIPANFQDRVVPRLGVEVTPYRTTDLAIQLRAGYFYEHSPAPEQMGYTNLVDTDRHTWSFGAGVDLLELRPLLPGHLSLDLHLTYSWLPERAMIKESPIDPFGDYVAWGHIFAGGVTVDTVFD
jgi:long-chain fatty acid transport protein